MSSAKVTAVICTYNRYELLEKAIASLVAQSLPNSELEILVIDNSPSEALSNENGKKYKGISNLRWIYERTPGLSNARNVASREARADLIAYLDDDAIANPSWAASICHTFEEFGDTCQVVGGKVNPIWGSPRPSWLGDALLGYLSVVNYGDESRFLREGEWIAGANIAYRADILRQMGGFDVSLGRVGSGSSLMSNEEIALSEKIKRHGGRIVYDPTASVEHLVDASRLTQRWFRRRVAWQAVSDCVGASTGAGRADAIEKWKAIKTYFLHCHPADRSVRALASEQLEDGSFQWQLATIYDFTICLLSGLADAEHG